MQVMQLSASYGASRFSIPSSALIVNDRDRSLTQKSILRNAIIRSGVAQSV